MSDPAAGLTALDIASALAHARGLSHPETAADFAAVGTPLIGGCHRCQASIAAYNAHPQRHGVWACEDCSTAPYTDMAQWYADYPEDVSPTAAT